MWVPPSGDQPPRWQSARLRGKAQQGQVYVQVRGSDAPEDAPFHRMVHGPASVAWDVD